MKDLYFHCSVYNLQGFRIRDILVRIQILGSVSLTNGSGPDPDPASDPAPDPALFVSYLQESFLLITIHLHNSSKRKSQ
jgi:hypothetical protein